MGMLDGDLQQMFGAAFSGIMLDGRHYQKTEERASNGDVTATVTKVQSVRGFRAKKNWAMQQQGYGSGSAQLIILQTYDGKVLAEPKRDDTFKLDGDWVAGDIETDPAHTHWVVTVTPV